MSRKKIIGISWCGLLVCFSAVLAEPQQPPEKKQSLDQAAEDPTASLMALQIADWYVPNFYAPTAGSANSVVLRPVIPFKTGELSHIFRATVPFITQSPGQSTGLADTTIFDLVVFPQKWGRWGAGAVALLPTGGSSRGSEKWAAGPALGFTKQHGKKLLWGLFNQNLISFAGDDARRDVNISTLQPIVSHGLGKGWSVGLSEMTLTYDWEASQWSSLPLGGKLAKLVHFGKMPVQLSAQYEYNFSDDFGGPQDTIRLTAKFLFPLGRHKAAGR